jgi:hypothetical protein
MILPTESSRQQHKANEASMVVSGDTFAEGKLQRKYSTQQTV